MTYRRVLVTWLDVRAESGWHENDWEPTLAEVQTIGFIVRETHDIIALAHSLLTAGGFGDTTTILKPCIQAIEDI